MLCIELIMKIFIEKMLNPHRILRMFTIPPLGHFLIFVHLLTLFFICRLKNGLLQTFIKEPEKCVKNCLAEVIGTILNHDYPDWNELMSFLQQSMTSDNSNDKEVRLNGFIHKTVRSRRRALQKYVVNVRAI